MRPVIDLRPILRRGGENFRNWLLLSALRCILLTNNFFFAPTNGGTIPPRPQKCHRSAWCIEDFPCLFVSSGMFTQKCAITGTGLASPRELAVDDSINLCPDDTTPYDTIAHHNTPYNYQLVPTDARKATNSNQPPGNEFQKPKHQTHRQQVSIIINSTKARYNQELSNCISMSIAFRQGRVDGCDQEMMSTRCRWLG